jgi:O-glycosyl hydrolase
VRIPARAWPYGAAALLVAAGLTISLATAGLGTHQEQGAPRATARLHVEARLRQPQPAPVRTGRGPVVVHVVQTTADRFQRMTRLPDRLMRASHPRAGWIVTMQDHVRYQTIVGFGGGLTDSSAWLIDRLTSSARRELMRRLFSPDGIRLSYIRLPIGASDYTAQRKPYSYDDMPAGTSDPHLRHFSVGHDMPFIIPTLRRMLAINPRVFIIANPWSAPGWMKTNQRPDNYGLLHVLSG